MENPLQIGRGKKIFSRGYWLGAAVRRFLEVVNLRLFTLQGIPK